MMKFKIKVSGFKNWKIRERKSCYVLKGEEVSEVYTIEARNVEEAEGKAIEEFEKRGYYFDEICWVEEVGFDD
ncbi:hypothetical protein [Archaeoglobus sp.]